MNKYYYIYYIKHDKNIRKFYHSFIVIHGSPLMWLMVVRKNLKPNCEIFITNSFEISKEEYDTWAEEKEGG